ncbi:4-coumarate--CoA ligase [Salinisphaera dokdonensis CL-ES53]|uniref:4-coumarate--CoA ligase n=1 Tax=Salinisphaera dokdonensis CL-ES53 TaxID=1304272 RepID=A0ABV2B0S9_9GAMM
MPESLSTPDVVPTFGTLPGRVREHAQQRPDHVALIDDTRTITYRELDQRVDRGVAALQRDGMRPDDVVALCAANSIDYVVVMLAALRAGGTFAPLAPSSTAAALGLMLDNCGARFLFVDAVGRGAVEAAGERPELIGISINGDDAYPPFKDWLTSDDSAPTPVEPNPDTIFNIIYSSGTTGAPKGIVHTNALRWPQIAGSTVSLYDGDCVTLVSTPLYSNTTLVSFMPALAAGSTLVLMPKFDAGQFLALAEKHRVTHAMLVPVQYRRLLDHPDFDRTDLSSFQMKCCTSSPFGADVKAEVLDRWPGGLLEFYGMTEGGGSCMLAAHEHLDKLHTVGQPMPGHELRVIDEQGQEIDRQSTGEIVGHSGFIMRGYHGDAERTRATEWYEPETGARFIRTGDIGYFDADGFLSIVGRAKETIISGGFNIFPSDIEAILREHESLADVAVFGVASERWGETPVAFVTLAAGATATAEEIQIWANERLGKFQRLTDTRVVDAIPRNAIGKVSRNDLRNIYGASA